MNKLRIMFCKKIVYIIKKIRFHPKIIYVPLPHSLPLQPGNYRVVSNIILNQSSPVDILNKVSKEIIKFSKPLKGYTPKT